MNQLTLQNIISRSNPTQSIDPDQLVVYVIHVIFCVRGRFVTSQ